MRRMRGKVNGMNKIYVCLLLELDLCKVNLGTLGPTIKIDEGRLIFYSSPCLSKTMAILVFQNNPFIYIPTFLLFLLENMVTDHVHRFSKQPLTIILLVHVRDQTR